MCRLSARDRGGDGDRDERRDHEPRDRLAQQVGEVRRRARPRARSASCAARSARPSPTSAEGGHHPPCYSSPTPGLLATHDARHAPNAPAHDRDRKGVDHGNTFSGTATCPAGMTVVSGKIEVSDEAIAAVNKAKGDRSWFVQAVETAALTVTANCGDRLRSVHPDAAKRFGAGTEQRHGARQLFSHHCGRIRVRRACRSAQPQLRRRRRPATAICRT